MFSECTHKTHLFFQLYTLRNDKFGMMLLHKHVTLENVKKSNREVEPKKKTGRKSKLIICYFEPTWSDL